MKAQQSGQIKLLNDMYGDVAYTGDGTVEQTTDYRKVLEDMSKEEKQALKSFLEGDDKKKTSKEKYGGRFKKYKR
jgi:hypothetical protein